MFEEFTKGRRADEPLFLTIFKNRLERYAAYYIIRYACEEAGLQEKVGTHTMRKTFGYHHYKKYKDVAMLQKIFNHSSPQITLRYIGIEQDQIDEIIVESRFIVGRTSHFYKITIYSFCNDLF